MAAQDLCKQSENGDRTPATHDLAKQCVLCGKCMEVCPVFSATAKEELSPRAKYFLLQELASGKRELAENKVRDLTGICLKCERCSNICPQGLDVPSAILELKSRSPGWKSWIWKKLSGNLHLVYPLLYGWKRIKNLGEIKQITSSRAREVTPWLKVMSVNPVGEQENAVIFPGCLSRYAAHGWQDSAEELIKRSNYSLLDMPDWNCCGFAVSRAGLPEEARKLQQDNLDLWRELNRPYIFVLCTTCLKGLREMADNDLNWQGEEKNWLASLIPVSSILKHCQLQIEASAFDRDLFLHWPCHARDEDWAVWKQTGILARANIEEVDTCCGFGGCLQIEDPQIPKLLGRDYWESIRETDKTRQILTECSACIMQLDRFKPANVQVAHWLDVIKL